MHLEKQNVEILNKPTLVLVCFDSIRKPNSEDTEQTHFGSGLFRMQLEKQNV